MHYTNHQERIAMLRAKAVNPWGSSNNFHMYIEEFYLYFYRKFSQNSCLEHFNDRYADAYEYAFANMPPVIDPGELIVGKAGHPMTDDQLQEWKLLKEEVAAKIVPNCGQDSHMAVDYELVLKVGLTGIMDRILLYLKKETDPARISFYKTCHKCLAAVILYAQRYARHAKELAARETDPSRKEELSCLARICQRVPAYPAGSFHEAVQSVHFITLCLSYDPMRYFTFLQFQLGHPDRYLLPYYEEDLRLGKITPEDAQLLLDCLGIQINLRVPRGLSSGYMVGGRDCEGNIVCNPLTLMCMQVIDDIRLVYPSVGLCYTEGMPDEALKKACEILSHGRSHPAIFNDDVISAGLVKYGVPEKDSHAYIHSTCVEITPECASNVWVASPYHNLLTPLLDSLDREYDSMEELTATVFKRLDLMIQKEYETQKSFRLLRAQTSINPLLSCLVNDCLERGLDIEQGGARYNWIMPSFVGMSNLADSLGVIRQLVFRDKQYTIAQLKQMLDNNFEGFEAQRLQMLHTVPKYGNDNEEADIWCDLIASHIVEECSKYQAVFSNANLIPSVFCWIQHEQLGSVTGATPDGRKAGFPLGDGSGPAQGRELNGPTASILSSTKWSHKEFIGGVAVNMKFSKKVFDSDSSMHMRALILAFMKRGGFEMQINVVDRDTLLAAQKNPEQYQDLVVRIGGYSDYFVKLSPQMQAEVLLRTEHEI